MGSGRRARSAASTAVFFDNICERADQTAVVDDARQAFANPGAGLRPRHVDTPARRVVWQIVHQDMRRAARIKAVSSVITEAFRRTTGEYSAPGDRVSRALRAAPYSHRKPC